MAKKTSKSQSNNGAAAAGILGVIGVAAAAAAGTYFLYGSKSAKQNRKVVKGWALKAKGEVLEKMEQVKELNEDTYHEVVEQVLNKYGKIKNIDSKEVAAIAKELKTHWKNIKSDVQKIKKAVSK